ncbi:MAG: acyloxyacyl hydrolase [Thermodesulfovibrionales bacterium]
MKRPSLLIPLLAFAIVLGVFLRCGEAADNSYEIAKGAGISLSDLGSTEEILLGAWIRRLSSIIELRIEPNMEFIKAKSGKSLFFGGVSPVFRLGTQGHPLNPFLDAGVGVSIGSKTVLYNRDFGSTFFFSPTAGAGIKFGRSKTGISVFARWLHHSNAGLFPPNEGIDSLYLLMGYRF